MSVHHVDVNQIRPSALGGRDIASERREVGGQNGRSELNLVDFAWTGHQRRLTG
jgi:hypothetical protein